MLIVTTTVLTQKEKEVRTVDPGFQELYEMASYVGSVTEEAGAKGKKKQWTCKLTFSPQI